METAAQFTKNLQVGKGVVRLIARRSSQSPRDPPREFRGIFPQDPVHDAKNTFDPFMSRRHNVRF